MTGTLNPFPKDEWKRFAEEMFHPHTVEDVERAFTVSSHLPELRQLDMMSEGDAMVKTMSSASSRRLQESGVLIHRRGAGRLIVDWGRANQLLSILK